MDVASVLLTRVSPHFRIWPERLLPVEAHIKKPTAISDGLRLSCKKATNSSERNASRG